MTVSSPSPGRILKPGLDTKFHIEFDWWVREGRELKVDVMKHLRPEHQATFGSLASGESVDVVNPETAEVHVVDMLQYMLRHQCRPLPEFLSEHSSLVDGVFHAFLVNGNRPMSANELADLLDRPAATILRTLSGRVVYKGLRPIYES